MAANPVAASSFPENVVTSFFGRGTICVCRRGALYIVALNRPAVRNALNDDAYLDLLDIVRLSVQEETIAGLVLTGMGSFFSSGADLHQAAIMGQQHQTSQQQQRKKPRQMLHSPAGRFMMAVLDYPKILAAAVNGPAVGIGGTLLFHCDLVYVSKQATMWIPFARLALSPEFCSSMTLTMVMGLAKANELLLLSKKLDADQMVDWNVASRVVPNVNCTDPFDATSLASVMAQEIQHRLVGLPLALRTVTYFCNLIKGGERRRVLHEACRKEMAVLDERFDSGQVAQAAKQIQFGSQQKNPKAKSTAPTSLKSKL